MERACVFTALFGGYEQLNEQLAANGSSMEHICFTDDPTLRSDTWTIRVVEPVLPLDPIRSSREPKLLAHRHLPDHDVSLYLDNSVELHVPAHEIIDAWLGPDDLAAFPAHSFRGSVRAEFEEVLLIGLDSDFRVEEQLHDYERAHQTALARRPLWNGMIVRRHHHPHVISAMERWWTHVLRYSRRDQLSAWAAFDEAVFMPRVVEIDNHESPLHRWPIDVGRAPEAGQERFREPEERLAAASAECERLRVERERLRSEVDALAARLAEVQSCAERTGQELSAVTADRDRLAAAVQWWTDTQADTERRLAHTEEVRAHTAAELDHLRDRERWLLERAEHLDEALAERERRVEAIERSRGWRLLRRVSSLARRGPLTTEPPPGA